MKGASIPMASKVYFTNFRCEGNENLLQNSAACAKPLALAPSI